MPVSPAGTQGRGGSAVVWQQKALRVGAQLCPSSSRFITPLLQCHVHEGCGRVLARTDQGVAMLLSLCFVWLAPKNNREGSKVYKREVFQ